jgi:hypothetical protein
MTTTTQPTSDHRVLYFDNAGMLLVSCTPAESPSAEILPRVGIVEQWQRSGNAWHFEEARSNAGFPDWYESAQLGMFLIGSDQFRYKFLLHSDSEDRFLSVHDVIRDAVVLEASRTEFEMWSDPRSATKGDVRTVVLATLRNQGSIDTPTFETLSAPTRDAIEDADVNIPSVV